MHSIKTTLAAAAFVSPTALAAVDFYDTRAAFDAIITSQTLETFESETPGDLVLPTAFDSGLNADLTSGNVTSYVDFQVANGFENTTAGGRNYLAFGRNIIGGGSETGAFTVQFTFGGAVTGFGFDLSGFQSNLGAGGLNITTFNNGQIVDDFFQPSTQVFTPEFYGFVSDQVFDEFRVNIPAFATGTADYSAFDDVVWGVPTPATAALLGLGAIVGVRRRR